MAIDDTKMTLQVYHLHLRITEQEWLKFYSGQATTVLCKSVEGTSIAIPAHRFRGFTTKEGIQGHFRLTLQQNRFVSLEKMS